VDFLVARSADLSHGRAPAVPPEVSPGLDATDPEPASEPRLPPAATVTLRRIA